MLFPPNTQHPGPTPRTSIFLEFLLPYRLCIVGTQVSFIVLNCIVRMSWNNVRSLLNLILLSKTEQAFLHIFASVYNSSDDSRFPEYVPDDRIFLMTLRGFSPFFLCFSLSVIHLSHPAKVIWFPYIFFNFSPTNISWFLHILGKNLNQCFRFHFFPMKSSWQTRQLHFC